MSESIVPSVRTTEPGDIATAADETSAPNSTIEVPAVETSSAGTASLTGQAAALMTLAPPAPGETIIVTPQSGATYVLDFGPREAAVSAEGGNLVLSFDDSGDGAADRQIVFEDIAQLAEAGEAPTLQIAGTSFAADTLFNEAQALAGEAAPLETAATDGPEALGGGATVYNDNPGELIKLLQASGVIDATELEFGGTAAEESETIELSFEDALPVPPDFLINEVGVSLFQDVYVPQPDGSVDETDGIRSFIELRNTTGGPAETADLTVEIINPDGELISLSIPGGPVIPEDGYLVISQSATTEGELYLETMFQVFTADGLLVSEIVVLGGTPWNLGADATEALAVNVVFQAGGEFETGLDTFAANLEAADLAPLTSPSFAGEPTDLGLGLPPADFGSPLLDLNFDTFNGLFTGNNSDAGSAQVFSRVNAEDSDSQNDWTANQTPADNGLNNSDLVSEGALVLSGAAGNAGILHVSVLGTVTLLVSEQDVMDATGEPNASFAENGITAGPDGTIYFTEALSGDVLRLSLGGQVEVFVEAGDITGVTGAGSVDPEDLVFAPNGQLYLVDEETNSILQIDPATGNVSSLTTEAQLLGVDTDNGSVENLGGLIASADGTTLYLAVDGDVDDVIVAIDVATGAASAVTVVDMPSPFDDIHSFMALAPNGDIIVADNAAGGELLYRVNPADGTVTEFLSSADLDAVTGGAVDLQGGFWFDADGNFFLTALNTQSIYLFVNTDPITGDVNPAGVELFSEAEIVAALGSSDLLGGAVDFPFPVEAPGLVEANYADPLNDDVNPQQDNPDPLAGQNFLQVADPEVGELLEGAGGPDFLLGGAGADSLYGGSQDLVADQAAKVEVQLNEIIGGALPSELDPGPYFSDHNDFLFGDAGNDALYGGAGGDHLIGGEGQDSADGGSGNDRIFGDDDPDIGGLPEGAPGAPETYNDVLAGDALNNLDPGLAGFVVGGDDSVYGGIGDDLMAGEALALSSDGNAFVTVVNEDVIGFNGPLGNDYLDGEEGANTIAGESLAIGVGEVTANAINLSQSPVSVGSDEILAGQGAALLAGEALALAGSGLAQAEVVNAALGGAAGQDDIVGSDEDDVIAGEVLAFNNEGDAEATVLNGPGVGTGASANNDSIEGLLGADAIAGEALAFALSGTASVTVNVGDLATSGTVGTSAGDSINGGGGADSIAGEGLAESSEAAEASATIVSESGGRAGEDSLAGGSGADFLAGELMALAGGQATVNLIMEAADSFTGSDSIVGSNGTDVLGGEVIVEGGSANVTAALTGDLGGVVGDDSLVGGDGADSLAGEIFVDVDGALTGSLEQILASDFSNSVGSDQIAGGGSGDDIAGELLAEVGAESVFAVSNTALGAGLVGSDNITGGGGNNHNRIAGEGLVVGALALTIANTADTPAAFAGNDTIEAGNGRNTVAGEGLGFGLDGAAMTITNAAEAGAESGGGADPSGSAGNDSISLGNGGGPGNVVAGDGLIVGLGNLTVNNVNNTTSVAVAGSDTITSGSNDDQIAGDGLATEGGSVTVNNGTGAELGGDDSIVAGAGADLVSGDAMVVDDGSTALTEVGGNDTILGGAGGDRMAGDTLALGAGSVGNSNFGGADLIYGDADGDLIAGDLLVDDDATGTSNDGGDDIIYGGTGNDTIFGDTNATDNNGGDDTIYGGDGNDEIFGNSGDDALDGDDGNDTIFGDAGNDDLDGGDGDDSLLGGDGNDDLNGGIGADTLEGGIGNDELFGSGDADQLFGGAGDDTLNGGSGADTLSDGTGSDTIRGGDGADIINLEGDATTDIIAFFDIDDAGDVVTGFQAGDPGVGGDVIDLIELLDDGTFAGASLGDAIAGGYVELIDNGGNAEIYVDLDGNGAADSQPVLLATLNGIDLGADPTALDLNLLVA